MTGQSHRPETAAGIRTLWESALEHKRAQRTEEARTAFEEVLRLDPEHAGAQFECGIIAFRAGQLDQAERRFRKAAALEPGNGHYSLNLGVVLQKQGDLDAAEPCYRQSIDAAPGNPAAHFSLGVLLQRTERYLEAEQAYQQCLRLVPNHPKALDNLVTIFLNSGRLDEAEDVLRQLLERAPDARCVTCTLPGYYLLVGLIFAALPGARVIHCARDPLDQCVEMYFRFYLSAQMSFTSDPALLARHYRAYRRLMTHWRAVYGGRMLEMSYENLVRQPRESAVRLLEHCGLEATGGRHRVELNTARIGRGQQYADHLPELAEGLAGIA